MYSIAYSNDSIPMTNELLNAIQGMDYKALYGQWRYAGLNNWYLRDQAGKRLSERLDAFRANLTAEERAEIEAEVEADYVGRMTA